MCSCAAGNARCCERVQDALLDDTLSSSELKSVCSVFLTPDEEGTSLREVTTRGGKRRPALFSSMVPHWEEAAWRVGPTMETAIRFSLWHINFCADLPVLDDFYLTTKFFDSGCDPSLASSVFMDIILNKDNLGILGPACSVSCFPTAAFAPFVNQTMISFSAEAFGLSDHNLYSTFYRLSASGLQFQATWQAFIAHFGWKRIGVIHQLGREFSGTVTRFKSDLIRRGHQIILEYLFHEGSLNVSEMVREVQRRDARIIVAAIYPNVARQFLCLAHHWVSIRWFHLSALPENYRFTRLARRDNNYVYRSGMSLISHDVGCCMVRLPLPFAPSP